MQSILSLSPLHLLSSSTSPKMASNNATGASFTFLHLSDAYFFYYTQLPSLHRVISSCSTTAMIVSRGISHSHSSQMAVFQKQKAHFQQITQDQAQCISSSNSRPSRRHQLGAKNVKVCARYSEAQILLELARVSDFSQKTHTS